MHIKRMHEMIEKLAEYGKNIVDAGTGCGNVDITATKCVVEMVEKLAKAEYYARISKAMEEAEKEDEEEAKYIMKKMKDEYGEEEGERRFYDNYRYKSSGRFAPKGRGSYIPIRGYDEMMMPQVHNPMEWDRDMDRMNGRMYYPNANNANGGMNYNMGGDTRNYSDGYSDGLRDGRTNESRYDKAKRNYTEAKQMHKGNTPEDNSENMKKLEELLNTINEGVVKEYAPKMTPSEKAMTVQKLESWAKELKQV